MSTVPEDKEREERISNEAIVDCYDEEEMAMGWYYYLQDKMQFPFKATCMIVKKKSRLKEGEVVEVTGMADEEDCQHEMWVEVKLKKETFIVPLSQLYPKNTSDEETLEAIEDWHYWLARGYQF